MTAATKRIFSTAFSWVRERIRILFALIGLAVIAILIHEAGARVLWRAVASMAAWLPVALGLELVRVFCDSESTYLALGKAKHCIPRKLMLRAQLIATALGSMVPAGRSTEEATKAALLAPWTGGPQASSAGVISQVGVFVAGGLITLPAAWAAWRISGSVSSFLTLAMLAHTGMIWLLAGLLETAARSDRLARWLERHFRSYSNKLHEFHQVSTKRGLFQIGPIGVLFAGRLVQTLQVAILFHAVGTKVTLASTLLAEGLLMLAFAVGAFVPGEAGVSEGIFVIYAGALKARRAEALGVALLLHVVKLILIGVGALVPLVWKAEPAPQERKASGIHAA